MSTETGDEWTLKRLMTAVVGSGPRSAEDMTREQAAAAMHRILDGEPKDTTLGAFWLANRWKRNTPEELTGFIDVLRERAIEPAAPKCQPVDCGANYDGKARTALLGVGAGLVAAAAGTPIVVHSGDRIPSQEACAYKHVLDELGVETELTPAESASMTDAIGFGFYYQPTFAPKLAALVERRREMGVRTFLNTIETLANPADAGVHLGSFYHLPYAKKLTETVELSETLGFDRVIMFQGIEGYDDIRPGYTKVGEWEGEEFTDYEIETAAYGMDFELADLQVADVPANSATITEEVLAGDRTDAFADAVALNAAFRIYARGDVSDLDSGLERARDVLADGSGMDVLSELRTFDPVGRA